MLTHHPPTREEEALRTLAYYHANGDRYVQLSPSHVLRRKLTHSLSLIPHSSTDPLVEYEFEEIRAAIKFDREVAANVGWLSLIRSPGNRRRLRIMVAIAFFSQWSGNNLM